MLGRQVLVTLAWNWLDYVQLRKSLSFPFLGHLLQLLLFLHRVCHQMNSHLLGFYQSMLGQEEIGLRYLLVKLLHKYSMFLPMAFSSFLLMLLHLLAIPGIVWSQGR